MDEYVLRLMLNARGIKIHRSESKTAWYINYNEKDFVEYSARSCYTRCLWLLNV